MHSVGLSNVKAEAEAFRGFVFESSLYSYPYRYRNLENL